MVLDNFKRTIAIDLSAMPPSLSRQDLVGILVNKFVNVLVKAIQFVPVKLVHVTVEDCATRDYYAPAENIVLDGISCCVLGMGRQARTVLIYHYPYEENDDRLKLALGSFVKVLEVRHQHYPGFNHVCTCTRLVKMVPDRLIRRNLDVVGYRVKVWYPRQPLEGDICAQSHISKDCPLRDKCRRCKQSGHVARDCTNAPNAWGSVKQGSNVVDASSTSS